MLAWHMQVAAAAEAAHRITSCTAVRLHCCLQMIVNVAYAGRGSSRSRTLIPILHCCPFALLLQVNVDVAYAGPCRSTSSNTLIHISHCCSFALLLLAGECERSVCSVSTTTSSASSSTLIHILHCCLFAMLLQVQLRTRGMWYVVSIAQCSVAHVLPLLLLLPPLQVNVACAEPCITTSTTSSSTLIHVLHCCLFALLLAGECKHSVCRAQQHHQQHHHADSHPALLFVCCCCR
jgi:hypothetical protein